MNFFLALAFGVVGIGLLYGSWTGRLRSKAVTIAFGWAIVTASAVFWVRFGGVEFGISWGTVAATLIAWGYSALGRERRGIDERRRQTRTAAGRPGRRSVAGWMARLLVVALLTGVASILFSITVTAYLPWDAGNRYVLVLLGVPVVWGALAVWTGMTSRLPHAAGLLVGVSGICAVVLFL